MKPRITAIFTSAFTSAILAIGMNPVMAQIPIRDLQRNQGLTISGVIRSVVGNEFILDDGTGQVIVDAGPLWYHQLNFREGERVMVVGEYEGYDFDAFTITREDGEILQIRPAEGPPPWAGGRRNRNRN
ncbi:MULTISPECIES: OB-fold nucleic acid binding domain-containing protein [Planktothricoides]|uniref:OB-fold nucleic acid binding domain-containing protein n=2 Tax=Planktothricoides raciborskii TaxID=132608 RepID=A0AAU8JHQ4_9CYAN|nr:MULTISPECIES: OB-fold nucleic acid binding domain-containing protein [Planktothricoides]KOR36981.1 DNA-binding protein [Planktothricoides sp. SR001]MBD2545311.1 OB-fold nucleic acid binding domain-containing protein [Planktothricoides raciborskii FACHB-1370]MBD2584377.1 OB-fold nucleic acid binding domain-containing protein [Planktothricoides raciborskii FACHB-1261]